MRSPDDPLVMAGPLFQPVRGLLFGAVFYLLRDQYFGKRYGWLTMWVILVVIGMVSTFGPAPGSIEGLIYTTLPLSMQLGVGHIETVGQSAGVCPPCFYYWVRYPNAMADVGFGWRVRDRDRHCPLSDCSSDRAGFASSNADTIALRKPMQSWTASTP